MTNLPLPDPGRPAADSDALTSWPLTLRLISLRLAERAPAVAIIWLGLRH